MNCETRTARASLLALMAVLALLLVTAPVRAEAGELHGFVNVNTATLEELQLLPGIGEARAKAVIEMRKKRGGFKSVDELMEVKGIGETALERLRPFVRVEGKTTAQLR